MIPSEIIRIRLNSVVQQDYPLLAIHCFPSHVSIGRYIHLPSWAYCFAISSRRGNRCFTVLAHGWMGPYAELCSALVKLVHHHNNVGG